MPLLRGFAFEGVANRDSLSYLPEYGLPSDLPTILRGTLRYPGFARVVRCFRTLGLLSLEPLEAPIEKWTQLVDACARRLGIEHTAQRAVEAALADQPRGLVEETVQVLTECVLPVRAYDACSPRLFPFLAGSPSFQALGPSRPSFPPCPRRRLRLSTTSRSSSRTSSATTLASATPLSCTTR